MPIVVSPSIPCVLLARAVLLSLVFMFAYSSEGLCAIDDSLVVCAPFRYGNLSIFPIESSYAISHSYLTLEEALRLHRAIIHENNSQTLWIENLSDTDLYIQSCDLIKGGQQDRIIESDLILPAHETSHNLNVFCVERDRSFQCGDEPIATFSSSTEMAPIPHMRITSNHKLTSPLLSPHVGGYTEPDSSQLQLLQSLGTMPQFNSIDDIVQQSIWNDVATVQSSLTTVLHDSVARNISPTSLELTLEHPAVMQKRQAFENKLLSIVWDRPRAIGVVYAIAGKIVGGDIYGSHSLFLSMWPKLLKAISTTAILTKSDSDSLLTTEDVQNFLLSSTHGKTVRNNVNDRTIVAANQSDGSYRFVTSDKKYGTAIHAIYLKK